MFRKMFVVLCTELLQYEILGICVHSDWSVLSGWVCRNNLRTLWFEELTEQTSDLDQLLKEDMNGERGSNGHMKDSLVHMFDVFFLDLYPSNLENRVGFPPLAAAFPVFSGSVYGVIDHHLKRCVRFGFLSEIGEILIWRIQDAQNELADVREQVARGPGDLWGCVIQDV